MNPMNPRSETLKVLNFLNPTKSRNEKEMSSGNRSLRRVDTRGQLTKHENGVVPSGD